MRDLSPWLGFCHICKEADDTRSSQQTLVAAWADSVEGFEREVHFHTNTHGLQMTLADEVLPAAEWMAKHPDRKDAQRLAAKVSVKHPVEIGALGGGASGADGQPDDTEGYLHIEEIEGVEPLDSQFGVHPPKTVPDALYEPLFGQPDPTPAEGTQYGSSDKVPPLHTYAILDAAKVVNFVEMLEASGLEHRCLFKGEAAEEMRDVAPYVVRLEEDVDFTRNLFSHDPEQEVPWFMWDREPGIYVRSRGSLDDMWRHFRKFTKVQDESGKWFYFRFWEGDFLFALRSLKLEDARSVAKLFTSPVCFICLHNSSLAVWKQMQLFDPNIQHENRITINTAIKALFDEIVIERQKKAYITQAYRRIKAVKTNISVNKDHLIALRDWLASYGFRETEHLAEAVSILETRYKNPDGILPPSLLKVLTNKDKGPAARLWLLQNKNYRD